MKKLVAAAAAFALLGGTALAQNPSESDLGVGIDPGVKQAQTVTNGAQFATMANVSNLFEIHSSQLAVEKAQRPELKAFAQQMIDEHTATGQQLVDALAKSEVAVELPDGLDDQHAISYGQLQGSDGDDFDKAYMEAQAEAHAVAIALFTSYAQNGDDEALKAFAAQTLPHLQAHQEALKTLMPQG